MGKEEKERKGKKMTGMGRKGEGKGRNFTGGDIQRRKEIEGKEEGEMIGVRRENDRRCKKEKNR